ncbi:MAG: T9SS C-terminal target domain-containing protein [Chlorobiota bacterium]|nr:MAG: T9SS C-terminal target domain-containing protein [Chlorobiota bacterium]
MPVELSSFYASVIDNEVVLGWTTATELNNARFEIERSVKGDSEGWTKIGEIEGHGTTTSPRRYIFSDRPGVTGTYLYRLKQVDFDGTFEYSSEIEATTETPKVFSLSQNYPNPFNPSTNITFSLPEQAEVTLAVYDITGREVAKVINAKVLPAGNHSLEFDASGLNSGVYLYTLTAGNRSQTKKFTLLK